MTVWLYQMSEKKWKPEKYRKMVWEGESTYFGTRKVLPKREKPSSGDTILLFYAKTGTKEPGLYGWGIILEYDEEEERIQFRPSTPSDYMKMNPIWDNDVNDLIDKIRGTPPLATMFKVKDKQAKIIRKKVNEKFSQSLI